MFPLHNKKNFFYFVIHVLQVNGGVGVWVIGRLSEEAQILYIPPMIK